MHEVDDYTGYSDRQKPILLIGEHDVGMISEEQERSTYDVTEINDEIELRPRERNVYYKLRDKGRNFVDFAHITVVAGKGGDGCVSFLRSRTMPKGPPSGGNGGRGGNVTFYASRNHTSLHYLPRSIRAGNGEPGKGDLKHGKAGKDITLPIPLGTIIREVDPPSKKKDDDDESLSSSLYVDRKAAREKRREETWVHYPHYADKNQLGSFFLEAERMIEDERRHQRITQQISRLELDLSVEDEQHLITRGGLGGKGNPYFLTNENRSPKFATKGQPGETKHLVLELKSIADAGLVGLPNAGKSTFLTAVSNAHPKIAPYPFTTLNPYIGTVDYHDRFQLTIADIPGLIKGAHKNIGLGHSFLRHVERSKVLVYVIDLTSEKPWEDFRVLQNELEMYRAGLTLRPSMVIANKADVSEIAKKHLPLFEEKIKGNAGSEVDRDLLIVPVSAKYPLKKNEAVAIYAGEIIHLYVKLMHKNSIILTVLEIYRVIDALFVQAKLIRRLHQILISNLFHKSFLRFMPYKIEKLGGSQCSSTKYV
ncbi:9417_t:CDS:2 [Ambispora leptoticha]|uniref:9417_t:CDS:1 n=1 Tax=Ambispora leptoticha TaxID=144679 RepID=A0A9N8Z1F2_9GLOM|nr:9417_t:CDS:2 [Ambispora leptoticha]